MFLIAIVAETNRAPFDLPEAEAELVGGYSTEYSGVYFSLFFIAEYSNIVALSAVASAYFFGGPGVTFGLPSSISFSIKLLFHIFIFVWIRATFPRYTYDQLMSLCWVYLLPVPLCLLPMAMAVVI